MWQVSMHVENFFYLYLSIYISFTNLSKFFKLHNISFFYPAAVSNTISGIYLQNYLYPCSDIDGLSSF